MHSANIILLIFIVLCASLVSHATHHSTVNTSPNFNGTQYGKDKANSSKHELNSDSVILQNQMNNITIQKRGLRAPQLPPEYIFEEYGRGLALLNMMEHHDYKQAVKELFNNDTASLQKILSYADTLPEDGQAFAMYSELYELMVHNKYDRIEDYITMRYMMEDKPRLDKKWSVLSQNLTRKVAERLLKDSPEICIPKGIILPWVDHLTKKEDVKGVLFKQTLEQLYKMDKEISISCMYRLLYTWEKIMPQGAHWVHQYILTFDVLPLRVQGFHRVFDMYTEKYGYGGDDDSSMEAQYKYKLAIDMYEIMDSEDLDETNLFRLMRMLHSPSESVTNAVTRGDRVCIKSKSDWEYLYVRPMPDGVNWYVDIMDTFPDVSKRGQWRIAPVLDFGDGFYLTNVRTGLDFSVLMKNAVSDIPVPVDNSGRTVYTFYGGNEDVTLAERDTKRTFAIVDGKLKMSPPEDMLYQKWLVEAC